MDVDYFQKMEGELVKIGDGSADESTIISLRSMIDRDLASCQLSEVSTVSNFWFTIHVQQHLRSKISEYFLKCHI